MFTLGSDPEDDLKKALKNWFNANGLNALIDGESVTPRTNIMVKEVEETRDATETYVQEGRVLWQGWRVTLDIVSDEMSGGKRAPSNAIPSDVRASKKISALFAPANFLARNAVGLYNAKKRDNREQRDNTQYKNPFVVECDTLTALT